MSDTVLYAAEALHGGKLVHVMGYANQAKSLVPRANAMLLPIPSSAVMGPDNMLDTTSCRHILSDYATVVENHKPATRGLSKGFDSDSYGSLGVQSFDKGGYSVLLAQGAKDLPGAMSRLPETRRPKINAEIFAAYDQLYPGWWMALCAWEGHIEAEPLLWWYEPKDPGRLFLPGLDAHDGRAPRLGGQVPVDHTLAVGSAAAPRGWDVRFQDNIPEAVRPFLAGKITGQDFQQGSQHNGDWTLEVKNIGDSRGKFTRVPPPGKYLVTGP